MPGTTMLPAHASCGDKTQTNKQTNKPSIRAHALVCAVCARTHARTRTHDKERACYRLPSAAQAASAGVEVGAAPLHKACAKTLAAPDELEL
jgi:hypothetical protein